MSQEVLQRLQRLHSSPFPFPLCSLCSLCSMGFGPTAVVVTQAVVFAFVKEGYHTKYLRTLTKSNTWNRMQLRKHQENLADPPDAVGAFGFEGTLLFRGELWAARGSWRWPL